ncbi:MAG: hypothetical protein SF029_25075 [bacterium]|nr:hypothetical protein [bacterium]
MRKIIIMLVCLLMLAAVPSLLAQEGISVKGTSISSKLTTDHAIPSFACRQPTIQKGTLELLPQFPASLSKSTASPMVTRQHLAVQHPSLCSPGIVPNVDPGGGGGG